MSNPAPSELKRGPIHPSNSSNLLKDSSLERSGEALNQGNDTNPQEKVNANSKSQENGGWVNVIEKQDVKEEEENVEDKVQKVNSNLLKNRRGPLLVLPSKFGKEDGKRYIGLFNILTTSLAHNPIYVSNLSIP